MATNGKKINELTSIETVSNETVLPAVYVSGTTPNPTAQKISINQISNKVQDNMSSVIANKQDKLTAGSNIIIDGNNVINTVNVVASQTVQNIVPLTQAEYDDLAQESAVDPNTFYLIKSAS